jgi:hypothetical protein
MSLLPEVLAPLVLAWYRKPPGVSLAGGIRRNGLNGGEILPARIYHDRGMYWCGLLMGLVPFRLVVPPFHPGVVGLYPVWGAWFHNCLPLEGTDRIQIFGP